MTAETRDVLGVFRDAESAANGVDGLLEADFTPNQYEILTGAPYPEGAFGEEPAKHRLYFFPLIGAACGLAVALLLTAGTQISYPLVTGGKPILGIPPMAIIAYEGTMLGAIIMTVLGIIFESRLPRLGLGVYDKRITEGYVGVLVSCLPNRIGAAIDALRGAGADDVKQESWERG